MIAAHAVDILCLLIATVVPAWLVWRSRRWWLTIPLGAAIMWLTLILAGRLLSLLDPRRESGTGDSMWIGGGWIMGLLYTTLLFGLRGLFFILRQRPPSADWKAQTQETDSQPQK